MKVLAAQSRPILWTVARLAPLSMDFSRQESWSGWPFPSPGDLPNSGIKAGSPALQVNSSPTEPAGKPNQDVKERHGGSTEPRSPKVGPPVCSPPWPPCLSRAGCPSRRTRILGWPGGVCLTSAPLHPRHHDFPLSPGFTFRNGSQPTAWPSISVSQAVIPSLARFLRWWKRQTSGNDPE